jgi:hypothetical protein
MHYSLVYDFSSEPFWMWRTSAIGLALVLGGLVLLRLKARPTWNFARAKPLGAFALLFGVLIVCWAFPQNYSRYRYLHKELDAGRLKTVTGNVSGFHPMPRGGHDTERLWVEGVKFSSSDFNEMRGGFNNTSSHGGPIREGLPVRIGYVDGSILRLEIGQVSP